MAITEANINIGILPNDGSGDPLRVAFDKINNNFAELMLLAPQGPEGSLQFAGNGTYHGTANLVYDAGTNVVQLGALVIPNADDTVNIGNATRRINTLFVSNSVHVGGSVIKETGGIVSFNVAGQPATISVADVNASGNLNLTGDLVLGNLSLNTFTFETTTNAANQVIYQQPTNTFNSAEFKITSREVGSNNSQTVTIKLSKTNDDANVHFSAFGTLFNGLPVTRYNATQAFGNVRVMVSPLRNSTVTHTVEYFIVD